MHVLPLSETYIYSLGIGLISSFLLVSYHISVRRKRAKVPPKGVPPSDIPDEVLQDETFGKALRMLDEARKKSLKILSETKYFDDETKKDFNDRLNQVSQKHLKSLEDVSEELLKKYTSVLGSEVDSLKETLQEKAVGSQRELGVRVKEDYKKVRKELEKYKSERIAEIDTAIYKVLAQVTSDILGKTVSMKEHEDLILKVLEDAKDRAKFEV